MIASFNCHCSSFIFSKFWTSHNVNFLTSFAMEKSFQTSAQQKLDPNKLTNLLDSSVDRERERPGETAKLTTNELDNTLVDTT